MNEHHYQRIDKGISRADKKQMRQEARRQPRSNEGTFLPICTSERRSEIIVEAMQALERGETTDNIAERHGIAGRTLRAWLISLPEANQARAQFLSSELAYYLEQIESATEPMPLARAREGFRAWSWIAERRESQMFGPKQEVTHNIIPTFNVVLKTDSEHMHVMSTVGTHSIVDEVKQAQVIENKHALPGEIETGGMLRGESAKG